MAGPDPTGAAADAAVDPDPPADAPTAPPGPGGRRRPGLEEWVAWGLLAAVAVAFLVVSWGRMTAPFGDSDEGVNGAVWAYASRSLRELGPVPSALGGRHINGSAYATHPPLIVSETALAEVLGGERGLTTRAPAWLGSLVALGLLYRLGRRLGRSPVAAAGAVAITGTTAMFISYGPMLDTPVTAFPFGVGIALLWVRSWEGDDPPAGWAVAGVTALGALAGWQCAVLAGLGGLALAGRHRRDLGAAVRTAGPYLLGAAIGVAASVGWSWWVYGDLSALGEKLGRRSGTTSTVSFPDVVVFQVPWLAELLGLGAIGLAGSIAALWDRRARPVAALSLVTVVVYAAMFREAAAGHQYWCYWVLLPTAIGTGWLLSRLEGDLVRRTSSPAAPVVVLVVIAVLVGVFDLARSSQATTWIADGERAVTVLRDGLPADQTVVPYIGEPERPDAMLLYELGRTGRPLTSPAAVAALAAEQPDALVYVMGTCGGDDATTRWCEQLNARLDGGTNTGEPRLVRAAELARLTATGG